MGTVPWIDPDPALKLKCSFIGDFIAILAVRTAGYVNDPLARSPAGQATRVAKQLTGRTVSESNRWRECSKPRSPVGGRRSLAFWRDAAKLPEVQFLAIDLRIPK